MSALAVLMTLVGASAAHAGSYTVLMCSANPSVGSAAFAKGGALSRFEVNHGCLDGGALKVADAGIQHEGQAAAWRIDRRVPGDLRPLRLSFRARGEADKGVRPEIQGKLRGAGWVKLAGSGGLPKRRFRSISTAGAFEAMRLRLRCTWQNGCREGDAHVRVKKVRFLVEEATAPTDPAPTGELVQQPVQRGIQVLGSEQLDGESGVAGVSVLVNGTQVSRLPGSCRSAGRTASGRVSLGLWQPCVSTVTGAAIQTNDASGPWREGLNSLRLCAADFAGNTACSQPRPVRADNVCPIRPVGDTAQPPTELRLSFADGSRRKTVRHRKTPRLRAHLHGVSGEQLPSSSQSICIGEKLRLAGSPAIEALAPTIAAGGAFETSPGGSRFMYATYWLDEERVLTSRVRLAERARPRFRIRPRRARVGEKVRFVARLHGPRARGKRVTLQVKQGKRWRIFRAGRANRRGRHVQRYRFRTVVGKVRFKFRARVGGQRGYPFKRGNSRARSVIVSG